MKKCLICGTDNEKDAVTCVACGEGSFAEAADVEPVVEPEPVADAPTRRGRRS